MALCFGACGRELERDCGPQLCTNDPRLRGQFALCLPDEVCIGEGTTFPYRSRCRPTCTFSEDCAPGERCAVYLGDWAPSRACVSDEAPPSCDGTLASWDCALLDSWCFLDGITRVRPFRSADETRCGYEFVRCPACASDGGTNACDL